MKTSNRIFSVIFLGLGITTLVMAFSGHGHQFFISTICFFVSGMLMLDTKRINKQAK